MTCSCCETGRCCDGANCLATTPSECDHRNGTFSSTGTCAPFACLQTTPIVGGLPVGGGLCSVIDQCACSAKGAGYTLRTPATSCDCASLQSAGVFNGNCLIRSCNSCDTATGRCVSYCPSPRECCGITCCPLSQKCVDSQCVNKCAAGTNFCAGTGAAFNCCSAAQKCCGSSGCLSTGANFTVDVAVNDWVNTGVTVATGATITITATGSCDRCAAGTVEWGGQGSAATPNGVPAGSCNCCPGDNVPGVTFCHMALIGKIGLSGIPFLVGSSYTGTPGPGTLYLRQNDTVVFDNRGAFTGTITTDPCPGYTPASVGEPIVYAAGEVPPAPAAGPGVALKSLLKLAGIVASPTCSCNARAAQMDAWGEWECLKRLPEITGWLKEEAAKRDLWFFAPAGAALILAAISLSALKRPFRGINK